MSDNELNSKIQLLNQNQRKLFKEVKSKEVCSNKSKADPLEHETFICF